MNFFKLNLILLSLIFQSILLSFLNSQNKDIYGRPTVNGNLNYPSGTINSIVNVNAGFVKMAPVKKENNASPTIEVDFIHEEDSLLQKELEINKYKRVAEDIDEINLKMIADSIVKEGLQLYKLERLAWVSSDMISELKTNLVLFNGYISYCNGDSIKTIYYNNDTFGLKIKFDASVSQEDSILEKNIHLERIERTASEYEMLLIELRSEVQNMIMISPSLSENLNKVVFNIVPVDKGDKLYFYMLPGSFEQDAFYMGGDYIFEFTRNKKLLSISPQHKSLIYMRKLKDAQIFSAIHTHIPGFSEFMTATDICQSKLYGKLTTGVTKYFVNSIRYSSEYDTETDQLKITLNYSK